MQTHARKLLVVIGEASLEKALVKDVLRLGAHGYTIADVRGGGRHGAREGVWEADRSIEMKVICTAEVAERIATHIYQTYCPNYAVTLYLADAAVIRAEKF